MKRVCATTVAFLVACGSGDSGDAGSGPAAGEPGFEPPVLTNAESPVTYPVDLYERQIEGSVILRLYVTEDGSLVPESTSVAESSGNAALDSAAVQGVTNMVFAPARQNGEPVAALFLQPVYFRHPARTASGEQP